VQSSSLRQMGRPRRIDIDLSATVMEFFKKSLDQVI